MQSSTRSKQQPPSRGLKQVKVDNWGTFFLQRLQQLYFEEELLDLTIKFPTSDITVQAHRLVITTCTDYFTHLERQQKEKDENFDGVLVMPPDMPYECVKSIISFMYTGQLEYWTSEQNALYRTAQKMNMTVLTKLLDAQFNTSSLQTSPTTPSKTNVQPIIVPKKPPPPPQSPTKKIPSADQMGSLPSQPLPGRKLPIWKRKLDSNPAPNYDGANYHGTIHQKQPSETTPGPSRFDLPEVDDFALGVFSSFDDITYNTKPIVQAPDNLGNPSGAEIGSGDRSSIDLERCGKNDTTEDEEEEVGRETEHDNTRSRRGSDDKWENSEDEWAGPKPILRSPDVQSTPSKRVRFELEEKENMEKSGGRSNSESNSEDAINNHAKIIREVLKKYPHLVKNNKNIRLKIMQKESKSSEPSGPAKTKVSYVVLKSDHLLSNNAGATSRSTGGGDDDKSSTDGGETGPWKCNKCDLDEEYTNYYMYRRHMQDVHEEKFDPRVCEHCGYKATKRNILMYHLYTKHNVPPPKSMCFPKCHACNYVALSETLLVRHQINHNHRPTMPRGQTCNSEQIRCLTCSQTFKDVNQLASHEINTAHGNATEGSRERGNRCPHCGKVFVRMTNLQVHMDCAHKNIRETENRQGHQRNSSPIAVNATNLGAATTTASAAIPLEPSSEAEALSHVASGIAASLGVDCDSLATEHHQIVTDENSFPICNASAIHINNIAQDGTYNGHELVEGQQMIMLIDGEAYQTEDVEQHHEQLENHHLHHHHHHHHQTQAHQLEITGNEQIVMQGTDEGMIVYIHGTESGSNDRQNYETYRTVEIGTHENEEIVEEVEEVEEVVEEVEEELVEEDHRIDEDESMIISQRPMNDDDNNGQERIEEVIQYVEEETEIVEYDDGNGDHRNNGDNRQHESMMIIEEQEEEEEEEQEIEEHEEIDEQEERIDDETMESPSNIVQQTEGSHLADEWDDDSADMAES